MKTLILETSSDLPILALIDSNRTLLSLPLPPGPPLSKALGPQMQRLLSLYPPPYDRIVLGIGPGSYTGIRVGAALAQALAFAWSIPLYTAPSTAAFALPSDHAIVLDARLGGFYLHRQGSSPTKIPPDQALATLSVIPLLLSPHPQLLQKRLPTLSFRQATPDPHRLAQAAVPTPLDQLELLYL